MAKRKSKRPVPKLVPTKSMPGTPEKIAVLEERAAKRLPLFHPEDGRSSDSEQAWLRLGLALGKYNRDFRDGQHDDGDADADMD